MINVKIEITTEAGDTVVDINQRCKEARLAEVLKSALAAFEGTDGSELGKLVLKEGGLVNPDKRIFGRDFHFPNSASMIPSIYGGYAEEALKNEFGPTFNYEDAAALCEVRQFQGSDHWQLLKVKGEGSPKVLFDSSK